MPDGVFSLLFDDGIDVGLHLVKHPLVKAVGFTGSYKAGKALYDAAVNRPIPIPVYAEMGSSNPVFVLPGIMQEKGAEIAAAYAASVTLGVGQFCTNPGLLIYLNQNETFKSSVTEAFEKVTGGTMLAPYIQKSYVSSVNASLGINGVEKLAVLPATPAADNEVSPVLLHTKGTVFSNNPHLSKEIFGPAGMLVSVQSKEEMLSIADNLSGHLTATVHGLEEELIENKELLDILEQKAGRVIINGFPTGVEVCSSMVHGGPFPATTDSKTTSVGTAAIYRFARPVCYQNMPQPLLPAALKNENKLDIYRLVNDERTKRNID